MSKNKVKKGMSTMQKNNKVLWIVVGALFVVIIGKSAWDFNQQRQANQPKPTPTPEPTEEPLPPELQGVELFNGQTIVLLLNNDGAFYYNDNYDGVSETAEILTGQWSEDKEKNVVTLTYEDGKKQYLKRINQGDLQYVNESGAVIEEAEILVKSNDIRERVLVNPDLSDAKVLGAEEETAE